MVKVADHRAADLFKPGMAQVFGRNEINTDFLPFFVNPVCRSLLLLIRTHPVDTFHHDITELRCIAETNRKIRCDLEARIFLQTAQVNRDDRNLRHIGLLQRTADKSDVVRSTAAAAGLAHDDSHFVQVILAGEQRLHNLSDYHQRRIAGIIVDVFQSDINRLFVVVRKHFQIVSGCVERRLQNREVDR